LGDNPSPAQRLSAALADRYRMERELGAGGMATVYLAHDIKHERDVAIKVLHPDLGAALGGDRFLAEIRTTARLQHPHIQHRHDGRTAELRRPRRVSPS
jgi:serine/threonine protein kinase